MSALACQIIEPPGNVVHVGTEAAGVMQRKVAATVLFINPAGTSNTVDGNTPAIPWTSGFGNGDPAPTTPGTVDLTTFAGRWVTFILAGADGSTQQMYVTQVYNWPAIAGPAGGRTVIPLDVWELHSWRYAGYEFLGSQAQEASGSKLCTVPASTDPTTHGDYGEVDVDFATDSIEKVAFPTGVVPVVVPGSYDMGWVASVDASSVDNAGCTLRVARRVPLQNPEFGTDATHHIASGTDHEDVGITFSPAYQSPPVVTANVDNTACRVTVQGSPTTTGATLRVTYVPTAGGTVDSNTTGITVGGGPSNIVSSGDPSDNETDLTTTNTDSTGGPSTPNTNVVPVHSHTVSAAPGTTSTDNAHAHTLSSHTHGVGDHSHAMKHHTHGVELGTPDYPVTDPGHDHDFTGENADAPSNVPFTLHWVAQGVRAAPTVDVTVTFIARG